MDEWDGQEDVIQAMLLSEQPVEPFPDVTDLFQIYNSLYFENKLGFCSVEWSSARMTLCAGICTFRKHGGCCIRLSEPLLKYRPVTDLKQTLLHEMIHAYMFLEGIRDRGDHGPKFCSKMQEINSSQLPDPYRPSAGYKITTHHDFTDEVDLYRTHWWQCEKCGTIVKRAMNRPPQPADCRGRMGRGDSCADPYCMYHNHLRNCGGAYKKIREPEPKVKPVSKKRSRSVDTAAAAAPKGSTSHTITDYFKTAGSEKLGAGASRQGDEQRPHRLVDPDLIGSDEEQGTAAVPLQTANANNAIDNNAADERRQRCLQAALNRFGTQQQEQAPLLQVQRQQEDAATLCKRQEQIQGHLQGSIVTHQQQGQPHKHVASGLHERLQPDTLKTQTAGRTHPARGIPSSNGTGLKKEVTVIELDDDDENDDSGNIDKGCEATQGPLQACQAQGARACMAASVPDIMCPVCMSSWPAGSISNEELNRHLDACLQ